MPRASMFGSAALISLIVGPSAAQTTMLDVPAAKAMYREAVHSQTSVIIDLSPTTTSCFVQVNVPGGGGALLRDALADELTSVFGAAKLQDFPASEAGSGALYGIVSEGSGAVPLFALNRDQSGDVATGVVQIGQRQVP